MPFDTIARYSLHALAFGLAAAGAARLFTRRRLTVLAAAYLAMVTEIIGLRLGLRPLRPFAAAPVLTPLKTTLSQWQAGPGPFVYHVLGNLLWFVPLGLLIRRRFPRSRWTHALLAGALTSLLLETLQYLLGTGLADIDDVLLNASGTLMGYLIAPAKTTGEGTGNR